MNLVRFNRHPFYSGLMNGMEDDFSTFKRNCNAPAVNILEDEKQFLLEFAVPGMKKDDFKINLENQLLTISSEIKEENEETDKNYTILHALDGYDEISLTGETKLISNDFECMLAPSDFGVHAVKQEAVFGGNTVEESAKIFMQIIHGKGTKAQNNVVAANAGMAIATVNKVDYKTGFEMAKESLLSGKAKRSLVKLIELSKA